jgi:pimeloyl-ACP methyl ester carboxylesterase
MDQLQVRIHGDPSWPALVYLPGLHGDWTLVSSFRAAIAGKVRFIEFAYPRKATWSLDDHAFALLGALRERGISEGWLIGESFGSQPAWRIIERAEEDPNGFQPRGLILSGGFVRYPIGWGVRMARWISARVPMRAVKWFCFVYARYANFRHKHAPETLACIQEFVANRTLEEDRRAIVHRYRLIAGYDPRPVARRTRLPVYYLAGLVDPLVPWACVRWWLRRNCPGYRGGITVWRADHNVLGTAPQTSARLILGWMGESPDLSPP